MSALSKTDLKAIFVSGARPTETNFADLIDSYTQFNELLEFIGTAISQQTGVLEIVSASATTHSILPLNLGGTGEGSLSSAQDALFAGETGLAQLSSANRFTNTNTFAATATNFISSAAGSNEGPILVLDKPDSQSDGDNLGAILFKGADSGGNSSTYSKLRGAIVSTSAGNENGTLEFITVVSGATARRFFIGGGLYSTNASGGDTGIDTINVSQIFDDGANVEATILDTVLSASGTTIDFTAPFDTVTKAIVMFEGVSTNGTGNPLIQIGPDSGVVETGYVSITGRLNDGNNVQTETATSGFSVGGVAGTNTITGHYILTQFTGNEWIASLSVKHNATEVGCGGGNVVLNSALSTIRAAAEGSDAYDDGRINVRWYGY